VLRTAAGCAAAVALLAGCGGADEAKAPAGSAGAPLALAVRYDDGAGRTLAGRLTCTSTAARASGALDGRVPPARLCGRARALAPLLTTPRGGRVACTQLYGGPQTLRVTGTIDGRPVKRRFARTNGCEIAEFGRVATALPLTR
jgi:hypothetical protein